MTEHITRRALLGASAPLALIALAACTATKDTQGTGSPTQSPAATTGYPGLEHSGLRNDSGYHLNSTVEKAPTITLYTDYQCPYCAKAEPNFEEAARQLEGTLNLTVRHLPLLKIHPHAGTSALAVQAAENQGKHLEMARQIFATQNDWKGLPDVASAEAKFAQYAQTLGLDMDRYHKDARSDESAQLITSDMNHAIEIGVKGTPSFVLTKDGTETVLSGEQVSSQTGADDMVALFKKVAGIA